MDLDLTRTPPATESSSEAARRRLVAIGEVLLCSSVPTQLAIGAVLGVAGLSPVDGAGGLSLPYVLVLSLTDTVVLMAIMAALTRAHGERLAELWLGTRPAGREALLGLLLVPVAFGLVIAILGMVQVAAPWLHTVAVNPLEQLATTPGGAPAFGAVAILAGGLREELQRAFLLRRFERHLGGPVVGVVVLSAAFGLGHLLQGWDAVVTTGALGAFWAVVYLRRRSSVAPVVSHAGFNALEVLRVALGA